MARKGAGTRGKGTRVARRGERGGGRKGWGRWREEVGGGRQEALFFNKKRYISHIRSIFKKEKGKEKGTGLSSSSFERCVRLEEYQEVCISHKIAAKSASGKKELSAGQVLSADEFQPTCTRDKEEAVTIAYLERSKGKGGMTCAGTSSTAGPSSKKGISWREFPWST